MFFFTVSLFNPSHTRPSEQMMCQRYDYVFIRTFSSWQFLHPPNADEERVNIVSFKQSTSYGNITSCENDFDGVILSSVGLKGRVQKQMKPLVPIDFHMEPKYYRSQWLPATVCLQTFVKIPSFFVFNTTWLIYHFWVSYHSKILQFEETSEFRATSFSIFLSCFLNFFSVYTTQR